MFLVINLRTEGFYKDPRYGYKFPRACKLVLVLDGAVKVFRFVVEGINR